MLKVLSIRWVGLVAALVVIGLDQASKVFIHDLLGNGTIVPVINGLLEWRLAYNTGVSFSMLGNVSFEYMPFALAGLAGVVSVALIVWLGSSQYWLFQLGIGSIIGGALGNGVDRLMHGAVIDFIHVYYQNWSFPIFNVADIAINIGVACLLLEALIDFRKQQSKRNT